MRGVGVLRVSPSNANIPQEHTEKKFVNLQLDQPIRCIQIDLCCSAILYTFYLWVCSGLDFMGGICVYLVNLISDSSQTLFLLWIGSVQMLSLCLFHRSGSTITLSKFKFSFERIVGLLQL